MAMSNQRLAIKEAIGMGHQALEPRASCHMPLHLLYTLNRH
jgi:hypothetical protein